MKAEEKAQLAFEVPKLTLLQNRKFWKLEEESHEMEKARRRKEISETCVDEDLIPHVVIPTGFPARQPLALPVLLAQSSIELHASQQTSRS